MHGCIDAYARSKKNDSPDWSVLAVVQGTNGRLAKASGGQLAARSRLIQGGTSFQDIECVRAAAVISKAQLCRNAGVAPTTYLRLGKRGGCGLVSTLTDLRNAVLALTGKS